MPSAHALVSTFLATGWAIYFQSVILAQGLLANAAVVSILRVICGHHTWAQIGVGASLGSALAFGWMHLGSSAFGPLGDAGKNLWMYIVIYALYLTGSIVFLARQLKKRRPKRIRDELL
eukprot:TRINITY_DN4832_c1_g2_i1.p1 TRINITY_DN4832_c1_g2~~TRINITY_DN4832_c1_g2_i1.p1  ORF type:complete len:119 (-),score=14.36 TRINITY_DN4832_c1_g2_i1:79-435(-)